MGAMEDVLNNIPIWMRHMSGEIQSNSVTSDTAERLGQIYDLYFDITKEERKLVGDRLAEENGGEIFTQQMKLLCRGGSRIPPEGCEDFILLETLRNLSWNYTHDSSELCINLGKAGVFPTLAADLQRFPIQTGLRNDVIRPCLSILHNCAKVPGNRDYLRNANVLNALLTILNIEKEEFVREKVIAILTLSYIADERDKNVVSLSESMIVFIVNNLREAIDSDDHNFNGFSAKEFVDGLTNLANNDENKKSIVEKEVIPLLVKMIESGDESEKASSCAAIWMLSLFRENNKKIRLQTKLREVLEKEAKQSRNAQGALWCVYGEEEYLKAKEVAAKSGKTRDSSKESHIMISYQWNHQDIVLKIKKRLEKLNRRIWIDVDEMTGSTLDAMAKAVENSQLIIMCISPEYKNSQACRTEAEYAYKRKVPIIPIKVKGDYDPDGWLGAILASKLYFDFSIQEKFEELLLRLQKEIERHLGVDDVVDSPSRRTSGIRHWSEEEVRKWTTENHVPSACFEGKTGEHLAYLCD